MKSSDKSLAVQQACDEVEAGLLSAYAAAKKYGVAESSVSRARKRRANVCPACGQHVAHLPTKAHN